MEEMQPTKAESCTAWRPLFFLLWTFTHCCTMAPCYQISSKYFGREEAFPLCHICSAISEQIGTRLCQFPISSYINQTVLKTSKLSHLAFELNLVHLSFCMLPCLLRMEEKKVHHLKEKDTSNAPKEKVTWGHRVTLEQSSA